MTTGPRNLTDICGCAVAGLREKTVIFPGCTPQACRLLRMRHPVDRGVADHRPEKASHLGGDPPERRGVEVFPLLSRHGDEARPKALRDRIERELPRILNETHDPLGSRNLSTGCDDVHGRHDVLRNLLDEPGIGGHLPAGHQMVDLLQGVDHLGVRRGWSVEEVHRVVAWTDDDDVVPTSTVLSELPHELVQVALDVRTSPPIREGWASM